MPTELSRSREGENQQSDQTSTRRDASPNKGGRIGDFAIHQIQLSEQQQEAGRQSKGKGPASAEVGTGRAVGENRKPAERTVELASQSTPEKPILPEGGKTKEKALESKKGLISS